MLPMRESTRSDVPRNELGWGPIICMSWETSCWDTCTNLANAFIHLKSFSSSGLLLKNCKTAIVSSTATSSKTCAAFQNWRHELYDRSDCDRKSNLWRIFVCRMYLDLRRYIYRTIRISIAMTRSNWCKYQKILFQFQYGTCIKIWRIILNVTYSCKNFLSNKECFPRIYGEAHFLPCREWA